MRKSKKAEQDFSKSKLHKWIEKQFVRKNRALIKKVGRALEERVSGK